MDSTTDRNLTLFQRAQALIPGGVNSPVRAFKAVGGTPRFIERAQGAYMWDANGQRYIDYIGSWGPMILGHGHPAVLEAVQKAALEGFSFGAPTEREVELAEAIVALVPSIEMVRLVSSGTEAGMSAIRLARGATGRKKILKFEGCYHGHADALLVKAGSGLATFGNATSAGVPPEVVQDTLVLEYNNVAQLEEAFALHGASIACVMIEPIAGNMNFVRGSVPFIKRCRELCTHGLVAAAAAEGVPFSADCEGGMFGFFLLPELPQNYATVMQTDGTRFNTLFHGLLDRGVYIAPALYEAGFVSAAHTPQDIADTVAIAHDAFKLLSK